MRSAVLALLLLLTPAPIFAEPALTTGGEAQIRAVIDGMTLLLTDGRELRLVGIDVPLRGALADKAKAALTELTANATVTLRIAGNPRDRQGLVLAQVYVGEAWLQGELLKRGLARVHTAADNRAGIAAMLALERQARRYHRGIWSERAYAIVDVAEAARFAGTFQLVSGTVDHVRVSSDETIIAFGADRGALELTLSVAALKLCREAGFDPQALTGKTVLVRGFIDGTERPRLLITHPEQIELLRKKTAPKRASGPR